ncbi:MAG: Holliday junction resolvase RuvX [Opitutales bacterium]|nr:Holliday junction resolvase RuvX [Opitutales bacterium]
MRRLGIDYGEKRWGISYSDEIGVATPLPALVASQLSARWEALGLLIRERRVDELIVGYPYNMDGTSGAMTAKVDAFVAEIGARFPTMRVHKVDERLSSRHAGMHWSLKKMRDERRSGKLDSQASCLILQDYIDQVEGLPDFDLEEEDPADPD